MSASGIDLDRLAVFLRNRMQEKGLSIRAAAAEIGCSPATLGRLIQGSDSPNMPDSENLLRAASWLGRSLGDFSLETQRPPASIADVEVHLRALPGLGRKDADFLIAMVKAAYHAKLPSPKKTSHR